MTNTATEALEAELKSLRAQHAEQFKRVADQVRGVAETVAKRPKRIRAPSGKIYEAFEGDDGMMSVKKIGD